MKKHLKLATTVAVLLLVIGVMVWPTPKPVLANVLFKLHVTWDVHVVNPYNVAGTVEFLHSDDSPFNTPIVVGLNDDGTHEWFTVSTSPPSQATRVKFSWNLGQIHWFPTGGGNEIFDPVTMNLNWSGTTLLVDATDNAR